jgi:type I restriction enzyme S subunit
MGMEKFELPHGWIWRHLGDKDVITEMQPGFACGKKDVSGGVPHLRMNNVSKDGYLDMSLIRTIPREKAEKENKWLSSGDVIFNNTNSTELVGKSCLFTGWNEPCTFSNHLTRLRVNPSKLIPEWLYICLRELWLSGYFAANCVEFIGQSAFNKDKLAEVEIPMPKDVDEQRRIVARIEELTRRVEEAKKLANETLAELSTFTPALLAKAFRGEL